MRPAILLFDLDGTLITTGGAGKRAIERAFERVHGRADACGFSLAGMTDRAILRRGLESIGEKATDGAIDRLIDIYLGALVGEVAAVEKDRYRIHPGVERAIEACKAKGFAVGLGTGNLREAARIKLERVDLFRHFDFGGFGSDAEDRTELVRIGAQRGAARLGRPLGECRVVVVGDTPKDVAAARGIGAECVCVATGGFATADLSARGATHVFEDLAARGALGTLLGADLG
jgi:phosphoglycolate phosphatase-like HAD superfamily hydrolase